MVCAFFIIFVSAKSFSFQLIIFSFKFMYIDTHSHIYEEEFREDREAVVQRAREAGVNYIVLPDIDSESRNRMLDLAARHPEMLFPLAGLHPTSVYENYKTELAQVEKALGNHTFYGIGECGIDLYWDKSYYREQIKAFEHQLGRNVPSCRPRPVCSRSPASNRHGVFIRNRRSRYLQKESDGRYPTRNRPGKHRAGNRFSLPDSSPFPGKKK